AVCGGGTHRRYIGTQDLAVVAEIGTRLVFPRREDRITVVRVSGPLPRLLLQARQPRQRLFRSGEVELPLDTERRSDPLTQQFAHGPPGRAAGQLADEIAKGVGVIAHGGARPPARLGGGQRLTYPGPVGKIAWGDLARHGRKTG